jgi:hypothetical protein
MFQLHDEINYQHYFLYINQKNPCVHPQCIFMTIPDISDVPRNLGNGSPMRPRPLHPGGKHAIHDGSTLRR